MAVKTRAMKIKSLSRKRSYRRRLKKSPCRGKKPDQCRSMSNCKYTSGSKRKFCRKSSNSKRIPFKGGYKRTKKGGNNWLAPWVLLALNQSVKKKTFKKK